MRQITDPKTFGRVAVLMGGTSSEREVSLNSGANVLDALRSKGVRRACGRWHSGLDRRAGGRKFDRVFNILHGGDGENGVLQGLAGALKIPFTGSGGLGSRADARQDPYQAGVVVAGLPTPR
jgi:D-alanine-D-alanine ligase